MFFFFSNASFYFHTKALGRQGKSAHNGENYWSLLRDLEVKSFDSFPFSFTACDINDEFITSDYIDKRKPVARYQTNSPFCKKWSQAFCYKLSTFIILCSHFDSRVHTYSHSQNFLNTSCFCI